MLFVSQREKIREKFVAALKEEFAGKGLCFTKGEKLNTNKTPDVPMPQHEVATMSTLFR